MAGKSRFLLGLLSLLFGFEGHSQAPIKVLVYPGTELIEVVQLLADSIQVAHSTYNQEALAYFRPYQNHPAVQLARLLRRRHQISCDFPVRCSWALYNFPDLKVATMTNMAGYEKHFDMPQTQAFLQACANFYQASNFWQFFQGHATQYATWVSDFKRGLYQDGQLAALDKFYRVKRGKEVIVTLGALNCGSYAVADMQGINSVFADKTILMIAYWQVIRGAGDFAQRPNFHAPVATAQLVWHEIGHAYLAPIFAQHLPEINSLAYILQQDSLVRKKAALRGGWANYLNENTTQAVTSLLKIRLGQVKREDELDTSPEAFYLLTPEIVGLIEREYIDSHRYKNFEAFFPVLVAELKKKHPPLLTR